MRNSGKVFVCGGDTSPGKRRSCPNSLHDWPLPEGYTDAAEEAKRRLARGWGNRRCPDCGIYGWVLRENSRSEGTTAQRWHPQTVEEPVARQRASGGP